MKLTKGPFTMQNSLVASLAEAWIEIEYSRLRKIARRVASLAEAWIEIGEACVATGKELSPPSRRRGLKCAESETELYRKSVASLAEAWIEIDKCKNSQTGFYVASLAEAWIEIPL